MIGTSLLMTALMAGMAQPAEAWRTSPDSLSVQMVYNFAACAAKRTPSGAKALLDMDFRSPAYGKALRNFSRGHSMCAPGGKIRFNSLLVAGGLAEQLLRNTPDLVARLTSAAAGPPTPARTMQEGTGICVARAEPAQTQALLATAPTSPQERQALTRMIPAVSRCVPTGQQARFNHSGLRALIALAAYRLANPTTGA